MKILFSLLFLVLGVSIKAQEPKYNNKIGTVKTLNIYGNGNVVIGKIVVNQTLVTKVFLIKSSLTKDSLGIYKTTLEFGNNEKIPLFGVDMVLEFNKPVLGVNQVVISMATNIHTEFNNDKMIYIYQVGQINRPFDGSDVLFKIEIISKGKPSITIKGVDGELKNK